MVEWPSPASGLQPAQDLGPGRLGRASVASYRKGARQIQGMAVGQESSSWAMDLQGDLRKLPPSLCLSFPITCEVGRIQPMVFQIL